MLIAVVVETMTNVVVKTYPHIGKMVKEVAKIIQLLKNISDLERLSTKVATRRATPRDLIGIVNSVSAIPKLLELLNKGNDSKKIEFVRNIFGNHSDLIALLSNALTDDPPITTGDGNSIRSGYSNKFTNV